jgi:iron complex outermembrane recepter protein
MRVGQCFDLVRLAWMVVLSGSLVGTLALPTWGQEVESDEFLGFDVSAQPTVSSDELSARASSSGVEISQPSEWEHPAATVEEWIAQIEASLVQITGVRVEETETGLQVVLETANGSLTVPETRAVGNALIVDISDATIAQEFSQANPIAGIALVNVT